MDIIETKPQLQTDVRWMIHKDTPAVLAIEKATCLVQPWDERELSMNLKLRQVIALVAEYLPCRPFHDQSYVVGFLVYQLHRYHLELLKFAVHPDCQRQGVGRQLIGRLKQKVHFLKRRSLAATVWETNLGGQLFLKEMGFQAVSVVRTPEESRAEDAYRMVYQGERC